jgi:membrane AbrB-like protein
MRTTVAWLSLGAATAAAAVGLDAIGLPSSALFAAMLVGLAIALWRPGRLAMPEPAFVAAQSIVGVAIGSYLQASSLSAVAGDWLPVMLVSAATLAVSLLAGAVLSRTTGLDRPSAALGMIAGGAAGIVTMTRDLGGDDRLVAFMQYLRVLLVVVLTPLLTALAFPGHHGAGRVAPATPAFGDPEDWVLTLVIVTVGALAARAVRLPAAALLGPMILSGALTLTLPQGTFVVPGALQQLSFAVIGLQVGLRFTTATLREVGRLLAPVAIGVIGLLIACFALALVLEATTSVSLLDAYLATTPGGIYAVLALAFGAGANTTFILAVQGLRVVVMVLLAPLAVRRLVSREPRAA